MTTDIEFVRWWRAQEIHAVLTRDDARRVAERAWNEARHRSRLPEGTSSIRGIP